MTNHRPVGDLRDWLTARIEGQLDEASPTPATNHPPASRQAGAAPTRRPLHQGRFDEDAPTTLERGHPLGDDEDAVDPETVHAGDFSLEEDEDPRTVRIHRMPVAFIGESVIDPATVRLDSEEVTRWRAEAPLDEIPLLHRGTPTPHPRAAAAAPAAPPEADRQDWVGMVATAMLGGGLGLVVVAVWAWMIR